MPVDLDTFRAVVGSFPTGVTIVTTLDEDGVPKGLTSNAFSSVSAQPPLLLVCVDKKSQTLQALQHLGAFVVNFLASDHAELSNRFASKDSDKFREVHWEPSQAARGAPILTEDCIAWAECVTDQVVDAGDHYIFIGRIEAGTLKGGTPLMYYRRMYADWPDPEPAPKDLDAP
jgi:flavin reductase (DIM6/NTAB) family NADH-FMN oxidoreductase RutF